MYGTLRLCQYAVWPPSEPVNLLLEQNRTETSVKSANTLILQHLAESTNETIGICGLGDETDTGSLERAEGNVGEELSESGRGQVDGCAVVGGGLEAEDVNGLLLEEFITSKLECALEEVSSGCGTETSQESTGTLIGNDLTEPSNQASVICGGVELYSCLDAAEMRCQSNVVLSRSAPRCWGQVSAMRKSGREREFERRRDKTYTSTGVRAPWVTEQQTAPAKANLE